MFKKILIANRGEIACRIIKTCRRMGIKTVAVYSEPDADLPHVHQADESYCIGPAPSRDSYLNGDRILEVARQANADAIHPGYGFLSEKADFAKAVDAAGFVFIGPSASVIHQMGDKIEAKKLAKSAGVSLIPGTSSPLQSLQEAIDFLKQYPGPALLKAAAGGGGKGMRIVRSLDELSSALERVRSEAASSFGDDRVFIERYIENPRHIEIQILGDQHGNIVHLGERDCSLQRRHQKVIEETPSPFLSPQIRAQITEQAATLAKKVGYFSAGTVEFILSPQNEFYFLEMNTRLQVEHPITEAVYNIDLVEWMIRIANGETLPFSQSDLIPLGHAIEARLYAENADQNFLPDAGRLTQFYYPDTPSIRFDKGMEEGDQISIHYDPMIAKIIAHTPINKGEDLLSTRRHSLDRLSNYLESLVIDGIVSNQDFLVRLLQHPHIQAGEYHTHFIQDHLEELTTSEESGDVLSTCSESVKAAFLLAGVSALQYFPYAYRQRDFHEPLTLYCVSGDHTYKVTCHNVNKIQFEGNEYAIQFKWFYQRQVFKIEIDKENQRYTYIGRYKMLPSGCMITLEGKTVQLTIMESTPFSLMKLLPLKKKRLDVKTIRAPMPGTLLSMGIKLGQQVKRGQSLMIIEAMKMENVLKSPTEGVISEICVKEGDNLMRNQVIARFA